MVIFHSYVSLPEGNGMVCGSLKKQTQQTPVIWVSGALYQVVPRSQPGSILSEAGFHNWDY